ncbi:MAG: BrnT family toxin [Verrucomicrobia bacterium]|nr:BrnT family toxin [Verrucomicrobiota bacterium]
MFEWDKTKDRQNASKHGVSFADTFGVFEDPNALTLDQIVSGEERHVTMGMDAFGRVLVLVYTWRGDSIRIISARKATRSEVRQYESEL